MVIHLALSTSGGPSRGTFYDNNAYCRVFPRRVQRLHVSKDTNEVTCKKCLKSITKKGV